MGRREYVMNILESDIPKIKTENMFIDILQKKKIKNGLKRKEKKFNSGRRRTDLFSFVGLIFEQ